MPKHWKTVVKLHKFSRIETGKNREMTAENDAKYTNCTKGVVNNKQKANSKDMLAIQGTYMIMERT